MKSRTLNISLPEELVQKMDEQANKEFSSRSDFIRVAIARQLRDRQEWGKIFEYGQEIGRQAGISNEEDVVRIVREYRQGKWWRYQPSEL